MLALKQKYTYIFPVSGKGKGKRPKDEALVKEFSKRLKNLIGTIPLSKVEIKLGRIVGQKSLWDYVNGLSMPSPVVLTKIAEIFNVSVDYLLTGQESLFKDDFERKFFSTLREAEKLGVAEQAQKYLQFLIEQKKKTDEDPPLEGKTSAEG